jgi:hypothetical protein
MSYSTMLPVDKIVAVTKSDSTVLPLTSAVYVGGTGDLAVVDNLGVTNTLVGLAAGMWHPIRVTKVLAATTATGVLAGYNLT